jgi:hypothetical protein
VENSIWDFFIARPITALGIGQKKPVERVHPDADKV